MATILGTGGTDNINPSGISPGVTGGTPGLGADSILGFGGNDFLDGGGGDDEILGGDDADDLRGGEGNDTLLGEAGMDRFRGGHGNDSLVGGGDQGDVVFFDDATASVTLDLGAGTATGQGNDTLVGINNAHGSSLGDLILGSTASQYVFGRAGSDTIRGLDGNDNLLGGSSGDLLDGGNGFDNVSYTDDTFDTAGPGTRGVIVNLSTAAIVVGAETVGAGRAIDNWGATDTLVSIETAIGSSLNDFLVGDANNNNFDAAAGNDTVDGGAGNDRVTITTGNDSLAGGAGIDSLDFGYYSTLFPPGTNSPITIDLLTGRVVKSAGQADTISGFEYVNGASNLAATFIGNEEGNWIGFFGGDDSLSGGGGRDFLFGGGGNDTLSGGTGDDALSDGVGGNDSLDGGDGFDGVTYSAAGTSGISVNLAIGRANDGAGGTDTLTSIEYVVSGTLADTLIGSTAAERFQGSGGGDSITGGDGVDTIDYLSSITMGVTINLVSGRANAQSWTDTFSGIEVVAGSSFGDTVLGNAGANSVFGGSGNDTISGAGGFDLIGGDSGNDTLAGGPGNDTLLGGSNDDVLFGGAGNDLIDGGDNVDAVGHDDLGATPITVTITGANDVHNATVTGAASGTDTLLSVEVIAATTGDDTIIVESADTDIFALFLGGDAGNDLITAPDTISNFVYADYLRPGVTTGVFVDLAADTASDGQGGTDTLTNIASARGSALGDTLLGDSGTNRFFGRGGNDSIDGGDGIDMYSVFATAGVSINLDLDLAQDGEGGIDTIVSIESLRASGFADTLIGSADDERFRGNAGSDTIDGGAGNDTIDYSATTGSASVNLSIGRASDGFGGFDSFANVEYVLGSSFNDNLVGNGSIDETLNGGVGIDALFGSLGSDLLIGGADFDTADYSGTAAPISVILAYNGTTGLEGTLSQGGDTDTLRDIEAINGTSGADVIGSTGTDPINGFQARGLAGNDTIIGTAERSTGFLADYLVSGVTTGVTVDLAAGVALQDGFGGQDSLVNVAWVRGTNFADSLLGTDGTDRFRGRGGSDFMDARGGDFDILDYTQSTAAVSANLVTQLAQDGEGGIDTVIGFEEVRTTFANDTVIGAGTADVFQVYSGNDLVIGGGGQDRVIYDSTAGSVPAISAGVTVNLVAGIAVDGWGGTDTLTSIERVTGTNFNDSMLGGAEANRFRGRAGDDTLDGGLGADYAEYLNATAGATVDLTAGTASDGQGGTDSLVSIEHVIGGNLADHLTGVAMAGRAGSDLRGGSGNDTLVGIEGEYVRAEYADQTIGLSINLGDGTANDGRGGTDTLINIRGLVTFGDHADTLVGTAANEWFTPSLGADSVNAGGGFDIVSYAGADGVGVSVNLATGRARDANDDVDTIIGVEGAVATFAADTLLGTAGGNLFAPSAGADSVNAFGGEDTVSYSHGFAPDSTHYATNFAGDIAPVQGVTIDLATARATDFAGAIDTIIGFEHAIGSTAGDSIGGSAGANALGGVEGNDTLDGRTGNDTLDGGAGVDRLVGGLGDDVYILDATADTALEFANQGIDTIRTARATLTLAGNFENVVATSAIAHVFTGNTVANALTGDAAADTLNGGAGNDTLDGGIGNDRLVGSIGNDIYLTSAATDVVVELLNQGIDTVLTTSAAFTLAGHVENLTAANAIAHTLTGNDLGNAITGHALADTLAGAAGNDTLDGGLGSDRAIGGAGDDLIFTNAATDVVVEALNEGTDTVLTTSAAFTLGLNIENLTAANAIVHTLTGNTLANRITGNSVADTLNGGAGNDTLDGGLGSDRLVGSTGDDLFLTDAATDVVAELLNQGIDTVLTTSAGFTLGLHVENLTATNAIAHTLTGNGLANLIIGNTLADTLSGAAGNDTLDGGLGIDRLVGGLNNDLYIVTDGDVVAEAANQGIDTVRVTTGTAFSLNVAGSLGVENLVLAGATVLTGTGNALGNIMTGNAVANTLLGLSGNDSLTGEGGADTLVGGLGRDTMAGGLGADRFRFDAVAESTPALPDLIFDFTAVQDRIDLRGIDGNPAAALTYVAGAPVAAGQVGVVATGTPGVWRVLVDINGGGPDAAIDVTSATGPAASWFLL